MSASTVKVASPAADEKQQQLAAAPAAVVASTSASSSAVAPAVADAQAELLRGFRAQPGKLFECRVTDPEKKGEGMQSFVLYKIQTVRESPPGTVQQSEVYRRYNDFVWLHGQLSRKYRGVLVPPIPDKAIIGRFQGEFISERKRGLEQFLNRLSVHPDLAKSPELELFLHGDNQAFTSAKMVKEPEESKAKSILAMVKESIQTISTTLGVDKTREPTADDIACDKLNSYAAQLETNLTKMDKDVEQLLQREHALASGWFELGLAATLLGQQESAQNEAAMGAAFAKLGNCADRVSILMSQKRDAESVMMEEGVKDYVRVTRALQFMMKTRTTVMLAAQSSQAALEARQKEVQALAGKLNKESVVAKLEKQITEAQVTADKDARELTTVTASCLAESERFRKEKFTEMKAMIVDMVKVQIDHAKKVQNVWSTILPELEALEQ